MPGPYKNTFRIETMRDFNFYNPTNIIFGADKTSLIGEVTRPYGKRVLLVYGKESIKANGIYATVTKSLRDNGITYIDCPGVKSNPVLSFTRRAIELFRKEQLEAIVAVGGGSVIDTAKTVAAGVPYEGDVWDFFCGKAVIEEAVPVTVVLTLAAAASEMNCGGVITNEETLQKFHLLGAPLFPKVSILDPVNTMTVPVDYTMFGAIDAIVHILERYFTSSDDNTPLQDRIAQAIIKTVIENANVLYHDPKDYQARANLMWCATLALNGIVPAGTGGGGFPMHMIEHSLSAIYDIAHGAGLAIIAPAWMTRESGKRPGKFARFAEDIFGINSGTDEEKAEKGINALKEWFVSIGVSVTLKEAGIPREDVPTIAKNARMTALEWAMEEYSISEIEGILNNADR